MVILARPIPSVGLWLVLNWMPRISTGKIQPAGRAAGPASREKIGEQRKLGTSKESRRWWPWSRFQSWDNWIWIREQYRPRRHFLWSLSWTSCLPSKFMQTMRVKHDAHHILSLSWILTRSFIFSCYQPGQWGTELGLERSQLLIYQPPHLHSNTLAS